MDRHILCRTLLGQAVMFILGVAFNSVIILLAYHTFSSVAGDQSYCTLWTDIPGRLSILLISCYVAGVCGCFPLPDCWRLQCLPHPFTWWKIWTWRDQLTSMYRDRCFAMYTETHPLVPDRIDDFFHDNPYNVHFMGPPLTFSPTRREDSHREGLSTDTNTPSYGATRRIQVPPSRSPNSPCKDFASTFPLGDSGNWTLGNSASTDVPKHPQVPWRELGAGRAISSESLQFRMSLENSDRYFRSSTVVETAERTRGVDKTESDEDEYE